MFFQVLFIDFLSYGIQFDVCDFLGPFLGVKSYCCYVPYALEPLRVSRLRFAWPEHFFVNHVDWFSEVLIKLLILIHCNVPKL